MRARAVAGQHEEAHDDRHRRRGHRGHLGEDRGPAHGPKGIVVRWVTGEKFDRIVKVECGDRPEMTDALMFAIESGPLTSPSGGYPENIGDDELPF